MNADNLPEIDNKTFLADKVLKIISVIFFALIILTALFIFIFKIDNSFAISHLINNLHIIQGEFGLGGNEHPTIVFDILFITTEIALILIWFLRPSKIKLYIMWFLFGALILSIPLQSKFGSEKFDSVFEKTEGYNFDGKVSLNLENDPNVSYVQIESNLWRTHQCSYTEDCQGYLRKINIIEAKLPNETITFPQTEQSNGEGCFVTNTKESNIFKFIGIKEFVSKCQDTKGRYWGIKYLGK